MKKKFKLRYLPLFQEDLEEIICYISQTLQNPSAADELINSIEKAIQNRAYAPLAFEPVHSRYDRKHLYYRIYVKNYVVYYVVIHDTMEVRRILYNQRNAENLF